MRDLMNYFSNSDIKIHHDFASSLRLNPQVFNYCNSSYQLPVSSKQRLERYLALGQPFLMPYGNLNQADTLIAFSFGDSSDVNIQLSELAEKIQDSYPNIHVQLQQEIALHYPRNKQINIIENKNYQTTADIAREALNNIDSRNVVVVAQSWHAKRCIDTCKQQGWNVVGLRCVDSFPSQDPQPWVQNPLNWLIKESHREIATGQEISQLFQLC
ncbi:hypothetical protein [Aliivibrio sifiae]|uniref:DUF218 domain-containing protein n=1 Tax=Aliivibrio sifiae TaxID=566293 RepID=A0A2S7X4R9_9GAMM|nr:hypothetical protein [Aliivibrio sifiae]PQJ85065.1 hypothetical protein BTO22_16445 [Aliivibrio sifiae]